MKIGVSSYSFKNYVLKMGCDYLNICNLAKGLGFDGIEFVELDSGALKSNADPCTTAIMLKDHCAKIGLDIIAYTVGANLLADDKEEELRRAKERIDVAVLLGAPIFRHDVCYSLPEKEGYTYENAIDEIVPFIKELTEYAAERGIKTCTENHGYIFQHPKRLEKLIDTVGHPNYGWLCDIGNFLCVDADVKESVAVAALYTIHVHAKDFLWKPQTEARPQGYFGTSGGCHLKGTVLGEGIVPVEESVNILKNSGYDGWVSLEFEGEEDTLVALKKGRERLLKIMGDFA